MKTSPRLIYLFRRMFGVLCVPYVTYYQVVLICSLRLISRSYLLGRCYSNPMMGTWQWSQYCFSSDIVQSLLIGLGKRPLWLLFYSFPVVGIESLLGNLFTSLSNIQPAIICVWEIWEYPHQLFGRPIFDIRFASSSPSPARFCGNLRLRSQCPPWWVSPAFGRRFRFCPLCSPPSPPFFGPYLLVVRPARLPVSHWLFVYTFTTITFRGDFSSSPCSPFGFSWCNVNIGWFAQATGHY